MNVYDGDRLRTALTHRGWSETDDRQAGVVVLVVVNTGPVPITASTLGSP